MIKIKNKKELNISKNTIQRTGGIVILTLAEYEELKRKIIPPFNLKGINAVKLDKLVKEGLKEYRAGRSMLINSC